MAERRMFAKTIIDSDAFIDMPLSTQALYFHLSMRADDDGFINNPKRIQRMIGCGDDDFKLLIAKSFLIPFESGIVVIKHWKIHNYIRADRYKPTVYHDEAAQLNIKNNKAYTFENTGNKLIKPVGIPNGDQMDTQANLGEDSIGKDSIDEDNLEIEENKLTNKQGEMTASDKEMVDLLRELFVGWSVNDYQILYISHLINDKLPVNIDGLYGRNIEIYDALYTLIQKAKADEVEHIYGWLEKMIPILL